MPGTGPGGHEITLAEAKELTRRFRDTHKADKEKTRSHRISREVIEKILAQPGCAGLRVYHGHRKEKGERGGEETVVIVGVTDDGTDMTAVIAEEAWGCPPYCAASGEIESDA